MPIRSLATQMRREWNGVRLWQIGFVMQSFALFFVSVYLPWLNAQELRVDIVHGGTHYVGGSLPLHSSSDLHKELAISAAVAMFDRNPAGFNNLLALESLFNPTTQSSIIGHAAKDAGIFRDEIITQTFQATGNIVEQAHTSESVDMLVEGNVLRTKIIRGVTTSDSTPVSVIMRLQRNENWATNGKYPMTVTYLQTNFL
jgi:hypothetical protein